MEVLRGRTRLVVLPGDAAAEHAQGESSIHYDIDLPWLFAKIVDAGVRDMNDPGGIVGRIPACSSDADWSRTLSLMRSAEHSLELARAAGERRDAQEYWSNMYDVFGPGFPYPSWR